MPNDLKVPSPYSSQAKAPSDLNPYKDLDPSQNLSIVQRLLDALGFTNNLGRLQYQQAVASNQWESEYALALQDRDYNDYVSQVQRMKAAGLNPDFLGVSGYESSIAGNTAGALPAPGAVDIQPSPLGDLFETILSSMTTAMSVFSGVLDIQRKSEDNLNAMLAPYLDQANSMSLEDFVNDYRKSGRIVPALKYEFSGMSKMQQRKANQRLAAYLGSPQHEQAVYENAAKTLAARGRHLTEQSEMYSQDPVGFKDIMSIISKRTKELTSSQVYKDTLRYNYESKGYRYGLDKGSYRHTYDMEGLNVHGAELRNEGLSIGNRSSQLDYNLKAFNDEVRRTKYRMAEDMLKSKNPIVQLQGLSLLNTLMQLPSPTQDVANSLFGKVPLSSAKKVF